MTSLVGLRWQPGSGWRAEEQPERRHADRPALLTVTGLRAYHRLTGTLLLFRPLAYLAAIRRACRDRGIPPLPDSMLVRWVEQLVRMAQPLFTDGPLDSLHLPVELRADGCGGYECRIRAVAHAHRRSLAPVTLSLSERACGVDGTQHPFFVIGGSRNPKVISPVLCGDGPAIARDTVLQMGRTLGLPVREVDIGLESWRYLIERETVTEAFTCDAGPMITPVSAIEWPIGKVRVGIGQPGPVTIRMLRASSRLVRGESRDEHGWNHVVGRR